MPDGSKYDKNYLKSYEEPSVVKRSCTSCSTYAPLIEKLTYGRKLLDVGFCMGHNMKAFEKRGWLTWGIDSNKYICGHDNIYKGDFLDYDFKMKVNEADFKENTGLDEVPTQKFDLIWLNDTLEAFQDPLKGLKKVSDLLVETGVIFISTPDIDFISKTGVPAFPHWRKDENYVMWSERALKRELERLGFNVVMCRRNYQSCFHSFYNLHIIAQKSFF